MLYCATFYTTFNHHSAHFITHPDKSTHKYQTDRLLLYIFVIATVVGTLFLLLNQPFLLDSIDQQEVIGEWAETHQVPIKL